MFSDHIPVEFFVKIDYTKKTIKNELNALWNNLKNEWVESEFSSRLQTAYANVQET